MAKVKRHLPMSATIAIVIHVAIVLLLVIGFQFKREPKSNPLDNINTINATVIQSNELAKPKEDPQKELAEQRRKKQEEEKQKLQAELEEQKKRAEEAKQQAELERKKAEEIKQQAAIEKQRQEEEARKKAEQEKKIAEQKRLEEEKRLLEEKLAEEKRKAEEVKKLAEEKKRKEEEARKLAQKKLEEEKAAEEKKRKEEEAKRLAAEKLAAEKAAEQERLAKILEAEEAELRAAEMEAQRIAKQRAMNREIAIYQDAIRSKIQSRWRKPLSEQPDAWCKVFVRQAPGGYVEDVVVEQCTGDEAFRRSVEEAVWKSDPLPEPPIPELFDRELRFKFIPET